MVPPATEPKLALQVKALLVEKGQKSLKIAKNLILNEKIPSETLQDALEYFMLSWDDVVHPALMALACESVGGNAESTSQFGVAYVLLAGAADVHDDIIDNSTTKYSKETVFGKYGKDVAILVGDALLVEGFFVLQEACVSLEEHKKKRIFELTKQAFFGISSAQTDESILKRKGNSPADKYLDMIKMKASVSSTTTKIGAILGDGSEEQIDALTSFGRTFGILLSIRDEFIDVFDFEELNHRAKNEWLPLPILYMIQQSKECNLPLIKGQKISEEDHDRIIDSAINSMQARKLKRHMKELIKSEKKKLTPLKEHREMLLLTLSSLLEGY
ncbi:MAG: polyprenyl synthetase family protein [Candidatus Bathyarchaeota archaeon]|nr:polyprenyl synthetase family protein [Candidatus Bathyarchaeota archaeon]